MYIFIGCQDVQESVMESSSSIQASSVSCVINW